MTLFQEILNEQGLLLESVNDQNIIKAVNKMLHVRITYDDKQGGKGKRERYILPIVYGRNKKGNKVVRAYETFGSTKRGLKYNPETAPEGNPWKMFIVDNIVSWTNGNRSFKKEIDFLKSQGMQTDSTVIDKGMTSFYAVCPALGKIDNLNTPEKKGTEPITKGDIEPQTAPEQQPQQTQPQEPNVDNVAGQNITNWANQYNNGEGQISIDNNGNVGYTKDIEKINAPATTPVTKVDVQPEPQNNVTPTEPESEPETVANSEPVQKTDVQPENDLTPKYHNLMER